MPTCAIEKALYLSKKLYIILWDVNHVNRLLQITFHAVPKGLCETTMQLPLPIQHTLQRGRNRPPLCASESPIATIRTLIYARHQNHGATKWHDCIVFSLLTIFFLTFFKILNHDAARSAVRSRHCTRIGRHNLDVYFSGQRGRASRAAWWAGAAIFVRGHF